VRLFVAVEIGDALAARVAALSGELQRRGADAAPRARVTWIPGDRMHLTIRFIGEVDDDRAAAVREALAQPLAVGSFDLTLAGAGAFPKGGTPRVLWVGISGGREELLRVEREISGRLERLGIAPEERPYSPHLTLARVRDPAGLRSAALLDGLADQVLGSVRVDAITLFQSKLSPKGPTYTALLRIPCTT
jgi:RNA 2',3'-cyclic 3'-phosphodiesterase